MNYAFDLIVYACSEFKLKTPEDMIYGGGGCTCLRFLICISDISSLCISSYVISTFNPVAGYFDSFTKTTYYFICF